MAAEGMSPEDIAEAVGATPGTVGRVLADLAAAEREDGKGRLTDAQERKFSAAMDGRQFQDIPLRTYRIPLFSRTMLPPGR
jgi:hypothetical protein